MNERIQELIVKSNGYWEHGDHNMPSAVCFQEEDLKKFVELIVRECQHRVEQYINECGEVASMPKFVIMKHFGVEA